MVFAGMIAHSCRLVRRLEPSPTRAMLAAEIETAVLHLIDWLERIAFRAEVNRPFKRV
jgi:hypothetical protein